jgi:hypothetical protein
MDLDYDPDDAVADILERPHQQRRGGPMSRQGSRALAAVPWVLVSIVRELQAKGYADIRVNQQQVDSSGVRVGINRPDVQATAPDGTRQYWELDSDSSHRFLTRQIPDMPDQLAGAFGFVGEPPR